MKITNTDESLLMKIYQIYNDTGFPILIQTRDIDAIKDSTGASENEVRRSIAKFKGVGLIDYLSNVDYKANIATILSIEENFKNKAIYHNNKIRREILDHLYSEYDKDPNKFLDKENFSNHPELSKYSEVEIRRNVWFLQELSYVDGSSSLGGSFDICLHGRGLSIMEDEKELVKTFPTSDTEIISISVVARIIENWTPPRKRSREESYKAELSQYLRNQNLGKVVEEKGDSKVDILINDTIPVEIKKNPGKAELDRLTGQVKRMIKEYGHIITCIVEASGSQDLINDFEDLHTDEIQQSKLFIITKA